MTDEPTYGGLTADDWRGVLTALLSELSDLSANERALLDALDRIEKLEAERDELRKKVEELEHSVAWRKKTGNDMQERLEDAEEQAGKAERERDELEAQLTALKSQVRKSGDHVEDTCQRCAGPNPFWHAPNYLWDKVVGSEGGILCPICFADLADQKGLDYYWVFAPIDEHTIGVIEQQMTEIRCERDELKHEIDECKDLIGEGGDGTLYGRIESLLSDWDTAMCERDLLETLKQIGGLCEPFATMEEDDKSVPSMIYKMCQDAFKETD